MRIPRRIVQKCLNDLDKHHGIVTYLEPDILECEVEWALGSIKDTRGDDIPAELFQILKDDAVKVLHSICQQIWKTAVAKRWEKVSFHSNFKEGQCQTMFRLSYNCTHFTCGKVMIKILQGRLQQLCEPRTSRCTSWI